MGVRKILLEWPVVRQLTGRDPLGRGAAAQSEQTRDSGADDDRRPRRPERLPVLRGRLRPAGLRQGRAVVQIEGDPDSPVSRGRLCPKGSASEQLVNTPSRATTMLYRRPCGTDWERLDVERAMDMIADRVVEAREAPGRSTTRRAGRCAGRWASRASAARPSTTKRTI